MISEIRDLIICVKRSYINIMVVDRQPRHIHKKRKLPGIVVTENVDIKRFRTFVQICENKSGTCFAGFNLHVDTVVEFDQVRRNQLTRELGSWT